MLYTNTTQDEIRQEISRIGKYELLDEILEGASAYSFIALHKPLNRKVFLKIYDICPDDNHEVIFKEPRSLLATTMKNASGCEYLVDILDTETLDNNRILVGMEYIEGRSLLSHIRSHHFPLMDGIEIVKKLLHGLSCLHNSHFVHRDIKPANVMLNLENNPKLTDFGSVARISQQSDFVTASKHSALYVPPEGWEVPSRFGITSDIYQVGMVLYELINGPLPSEYEYWIDNDAKKELKQKGLTYADLDDFSKALLHEVWVKTG